MVRPVLVFPLYAAPDEWLYESFGGQIAPLRREGLIQTWDPHKLSPGADLSLIPAELERAQIVVVLLSASLLANDALTALLQAALLRMPQQRVLLVRLRPIAWRTPDGLAVLPQSGRAVTEHDPMDSAFVEVAQALEVLVRGLLAREDKPQRESGAKRAAPGGPYDKETYVPREDLEQRILDHLRQPGTPAILLGPRGAGKTWLIKRTMQLFEAEEPGPQHALCINIAAASAEERDDALLLFRFLATQTVDKLARLELDAARWGAEALGLAFSPGHTPAMQFSRFLRMLLEHMPGPLALGIDHVDQIDLETVRTDLFALLRAHMQDAENPPWSQLRLAIGAATSLLVDPMANSPLFLAIFEIPVDGMNQAQMRRLADLYGIVATPTDLAELEAWVGGSPSLARVVLYSAARGRISLADWLDRHRERGGLEDLGVQRTLHEHLTLPIMHDPQLRALLCRVVHDPRLRLSPAEQFRLMRTGIIQATRRGYKVTCKLYERHILELCHDCSPEEDGKAI